eukprot:5378769-Pleurochrysis_carterae.AAC.1
MASRAMTVDPALFVFAEAFKLKRSIHGSIRLRITLSCLTHGSTLARSRAAGDCTLSQHGTRYAQASIRSSSSPTICNLTHGGTFKEEEAFLKSARGNAHEAESSFNDLLPPY